MLTKSEIVWFDFQLEERSVVELNEGLGIRPRQHLSVATTSVRWVALREQDASRHVGGDFTLSLLHALRRCGQDGSI